MYVYMDMGKKGLLEPGLKKLAFLDYSESTA